MRGNQRSAIITLCNAIGTGCTYTAFLRYAHDYAVAMQQRPHSPRRIKVAARRKAAGQSVFGKRGAR